MKNRALVGQYPGCGFKWLEWITWRHREWRVLGYLGIQIKNIDIPGPERCSHNHWGAVLTLTLSEERLEAWATPRKMVPADLVASPGKDKSYFTKRVWGLSLTSSMYTGSSVPRGEPLSYALGHTNSSRKSPFKSSWSQFDLLIQGWGL